MRIGANFESRDPLIPLRQMEGEPTQDFLITIYLCSCPLTADQSSSQRQGLLRQGREMRYSEFRHHGVVVRPRIN